MAINNNKTPTVILVVAGKDFQPVEYSDTAKVLKESGIQVLVASNRKDTAVATDGHPLNVDITIDKITPDKYDGIFLIGGKGALENLDNRNMYFVLEEAQKHNKFYGAICISPRILAYARVLDNKKATGWNEDNKLEDIFKAHNIKYIKEPVVTDGKVITATGPKAALSFGHEIAGLLKK